MKHRLKMLLTVTFVISIGVIAWTIKQGSYTGEDAWKELMALDPDTSMNRKRATLMYHKLWTLRIIK